MSAETKKITLEEYQRGGHEHEGGGWWEYDAQGIELCKVCAACVDVALAGYRPEILTGYDQSDVDEPIEPEETAVLDALEICNACDVRPMAEGSRAGYCESCEMEARSAK